eukprot:15609_6
MQRACKDEPTCSAASDGACGWSVCRKANTKSFPKRTSSTNTSTMICRQSFWKRTSRRNISLLSRPSNAPEESSLVCRKSKAVS